MAPTELGCAQNPDGSLKDVSEILWFNDKDEDVPLHAAPSASSSASTSSAPPTLHPFFSSQTPAAAFIAGSRRSKRTARPSSRLLDPDNVMNTSSASNSASSCGIKRKAQSPKPMRRVSQKVVLSGSEAEYLDEAQAQQSPCDGDTDNDDISLAQPAAIEYGALKAMADADHKAIHARVKDDATADLRTIFRCDKEYKNSDTGKIQNGHWCKICEASPCIDKKSAFLTGSTSSLRMHIARRKDHVEKYIERCTSLNIHMHPRALSQTVTEFSDGLHQTNLDGVVTYEPKQPPFTTSGLLDYTIELIVREDKAFILVEKAPFRGILRYCRPELSDKDIPNRCKVREEILKRADCVVEIIREKLKRLPCKISFTFDAWTSDPADPYLSITAHYIDASPECPNDWELRTEQLAFEPIEGRHTGKNIASILTKTVDRYEIRGKVGWFTCDGASVNGTTIREFEKELDDKDAGWTAEEHDILCMEHSLHIACKHFVEAVAPASPSSIRSKIKKMLSKAHEVGGLDLDKLETELAGLDLDAIDDILEGDDGASNFTAGDALGKALALVKQIRMSPQARTFFKSSCNQVGIQPRELLLWVRTRWASLYKFLDRLLQLRKGIDQFILLADASDKVPDLSKNRSYADFQLSKKDWDRIEILHDVLREPANVQQTFSCEQTPTVWRIIPSLEFLMKRWESMAEQPHYRDVKEAIIEGVLSFKKWYHKVDHTSDAYFICLVLDPNVKDLYCRHRWEPEQYAVGMKRLEEVFDAYYIPPSNSIEFKSTDSNSASISTNANISRYGSSFLLDAVQSFQQEKASGSPSDELRMYLESGVERTDNVIGWWGHQLDSKYPTMRRIARDYLAIQGSATPSERAFSGGGITDTVRRNRLSMNVFSALQILKSAYRNGHISAVYQATKHVDAVIAELDDKDFISEDED